MKALVFDTGPLISLALNNLLWIIKPLKEKFKGEFYITDSVKKECVERPLKSKKFKFEALQILSLIESGLIKVYENHELKEKTNALLELANSQFKVHDNYVKNVQYAEIDAIVATQLLDANAVVIDEFITRTLIEDPRAVEKRMERKLHTDVMVDEHNLHKFKEAVSGVTVIRSFELVTVAFEQGLFEKYYLNLENPKKTLLEGLLWAVKLNGCSVSEHEIKEVMGIENV
jgi:hypothetical protein